MRIKSYEQKLIPKLWCCIGALWILVVVLWVSLIFCRATHADTVTITFTGTVAPYSWTDAGYIPGNPLAGQSFSTVWALDACAGCSTGQVLSILLTIGGDAFPYALGSYMPASISPTGIYVNDTVVPGTVALNSFVTTSSNVFPDNLTTPFTYHVTDGDNLRSPFQLGGSFWLNPGPDGYLKMDNVKLDNPDYVSVPAPSLPWWLAFLAFLRRRPKPEIFCEYCDGDHSSEGHYEYHKPHA